MTTKTQLSTTGYQRDVQGHWIEKDPQAQLIYSMDWSDWLISNDTVASVTYSVAPTGNNQDLQVVQSGVQLGYLTFVELRLGQVGETYTVTARVTTTDGRIDRRSFRIKCKNRYV